MNCVAAVVLVVTHVLNELQWPLRFSCGSVAAVSMNMLASMCTGVKLGLVMS